MYPEKPNHATGRRGSPRGHVLKQYPPLCLFELRVPLDKFLRAASRKAHGEAAVFVVALHAHDRSNSKTRVANLSPQHGIGVAATFCSGAWQGILSHLAARSCLRLLRTAAHTTQKFFGRVRILGVGLVAARLADFRHRAANR